MRLSVLISLFLFSTTLSAGFYKWVDSEGVVHYTDHPVEQAEELRVPGVKDRSAKADSEKPGETGEIEETAEQNQQLGEYTEFEIVDPEQNQTLRSDGGEVGVGMLLQPGLQAGHNISLSVDGKPLKQSNLSTQLMLRNVTRGSHSLQASVIDEEGQVLITAPVVNFHMRKAALPKTEP